jgi:hypothetical protein
MAEVRKCPSTLCALWRFRMGKEIKDGETSSENPSFSDDFEDEDLSDELTLSCE